MFRRIVFSACLAGLLAGVVLTAIQMLQVIPIILQAETYESQAAVPASSASTEASHAHPDENSRSGPRHDHGERWAPQDSWERTLWTAIANVAMAIGFALLLVAIYSLRAGREEPGEHGGSDWQRGLLWGLGGYLTFFVSPAVGLTPELPGAAAAALGERQEWWVITVVATGVGLYLLVLGKHWAAKAAGALLIALPHVMGAPQPDAHGSSAPAELAVAFVYATALANAAFWAVLGVSSAYAFRKLA
jgi:cobalt transporter subunit CbtA